MLFPALMAYQASLLTLSLFAQQKAVYISAVCLAILDGAQLLPCRIFCNTVCGTWQEPPHALYNPLYLPRYQYHMDEYYLHFIPNLYGLGPPRPDIQE